MSPDTCPRCGEPASGNFCATCGANLQVKACPNCGAKPEPGARFCTRCGSAMTGGGSGPVGAQAAASSRDGGGGDSQIGWWAAGGLLVVLMMVVAWPILRPDEVGGPPTGGTGAAVSSGGGPASGASSVDITSMTPREAADALYNRVMRYASAGDSANLVAFMPMAIGAHERAQPMDVDGHFHLASLQLLAGDFAGALATSRSALEEAPNHLLANYSAAQAAAEMGDEATAREHYQAILDHWDAEMSSGNIDYESHADMMDGIRQTAQAAVGG